MSEKPLELAAFIAMVEGSKQLVAMVRAVDSVPTELIKNMADAVTRFESTRGEPGWFKAMKEIGLAAKELATAVGPNLKNQEQALAKTRERLMVETMLGEKNQKLTARYRTSIEKSMAAQLQLLADLRDQVKKARRRKMNSAFSVGMKPAKVTLRVIR